jgi:hypothetical protein
MSGRIGTEDLDDKIAEELGKFGKWIEENGKFNPLTDDIYKCGDEKQGKKLEPVLKALGYNVCNFHLVLARGSLLEAP